MKEAPEDDTARETPAHSQSSPPAQTSETDETFASAVLNTSPLNTAPLNTPRSNLFKDASPGNVNTLSEGHRISFTGARVEDKPTTLPPAASGQGEAEHETPGNVSKVYSVLGPGGIPKAPYASFEGKSYASFEGKSASTGALEVHGGQAEDRAAHETPHTSAPGLPWEQIVRSDPPFRQRFFVQNEPQGWVPGPPPSPPWLTHSHASDDATYQVVQEYADRQRRFPAALSQLSQGAHVSDTPLPLRVASDPQTLHKEKSVADVPSIDSIPQQVSTANQFALDAEGRIDLVPDPLHSDGLQREIYQEVRHKALGLSALGHNQLADLSAPIGRFLAAAPERIEDGSITRLWSRGNTLRLRLKAHGTAAASTDHTDPALLLPLVAEMLRDLVESYNVFIAGDPRGRELDQVRLGPQERHAAQAVVDAALMIVVAVRASEGLATTAAVNALTEQVEAARDAPAGIDGDQAIDLSRRTASNFIAEILRVAFEPIRKLIAAGKAEAKFAWKESRAQAYRMAAITGIPAACLYRQEIIAFIVDNADALKTFVEQAFHNPTLVRIIDVISQTAGSP